MTTITKAQGYARRVLEDSTDETARAVARALLALTAGTDEERALIIVTAGNDEYSRVDRENEERFHKGEPVVQQGSLPEVIAKHVSAFAAAVRAEEREATLRSVSFIEAATKIRALTPPPAPGHTDLMVSPESIAEIMPPASGDREGLAREVALLIANNMDCRRGLTCAVTGDCACAKTADAILAAGYRRG